ncbi:MAG: dTDP-4-dehydrorhamnose 3,5-epimerase [Gammaproteobacteria bacterium]|nr:dTDP-4-dehydrorhamnose 3,5-epimerase [Gammaproteobacteria bacterium]
MNLIETNLSVVKLLEPRAFSDKRGLFFESYNQQSFAEVGLNDVWIQDNHSCSTRSGTIRGMHYQVAPAAQAKLIRVIRGSIYDVAIDVRVGSPTRGQYVGVELSAENKLQLYVPTGFAHGFCTLENETEVLYKTTALYSPECEGGILWDDPDIGITWPVSENQVTITDKDAELPRLRDQTKF